MSAVRSLLDKIEMGKLASLPDINKDDGDDPFAADKQAQ